MSRRLISVIVVLCMAIWLAPSAWAQEPGDQPDHPKDTIANLLDPSALNEQLAGMVVKVLDTYLDYLARPKTVEKLATFQKNYYEALIKKGFTEEQAFQLVRDMGNPLSALSGHKAQ
jgi:hypothetical protein